MGGDCYVKMKETEIDLSSMLPAVVDAVVVVQDLLTSEKRIISYTVYAASVNEKYSTTKLMENKS